jgi:dephospho-CoA kinase
VVLTGGIGSGKSEVGRLLAAFGAHVVDADELARTVVQPGTPGLAAVEAAFGPRVIASDGTLNRPELATMVFGQPERLAALEAIVHPLVEALAVSQLAAGSGAPVLVYEVPLLGRSPEFPQSAASRPVVVVVDAPDAVRVERLRQRGLSEEQIDARMAAQPSREAWISAADRVVDNGGDLHHLQSQVQALWRELTMPEPPNASAPVTPAG